MSPVVQTVARILCTAIVVFGIYILLHVHSVAPGGGFQGGAVVASAIALLIVAFDSKFLNKDRLTYSLFLGLLLFISIGFIGLLDQAFLHNSLLMSMTKTGNILFLNIAIGFSVTGSLGLLLMRFSSIPKKEGEAI
jgi:multicomponent Na+:H+ antiporter subunit B